MHPDCAQAEPSLLELDCLTPRVVLLPLAEAALQAGPVQLVLQLRATGTGHAPPSSNGGGTELPLHTSIAITSVDAFLPTAVTHWQQRLTSSPAEQAFEVTVDLQSTPLEAGTLTVGGRGSLILASG